MGTRADYYVGRGSNAEWLGSTAWDGYPSGKRAIWEAKTETEYRAAVEAEIKEDDGTRPEQGWPWPWETSSLTDYTYAWVDDYLGGAQVLCSATGSPWYEPGCEKSLHPDDEAGPEACPWDDGAPDATFPDMTHIKRVTFGPRSGLIVVGPHGPLDLP